MARALEYAPQFDVAQLVQRGLTTLLACPVYRDGELRVPTEGTVTIYDGNGDEVDSGAVTVTNGVATFELDSTMTDELDLGYGWRIEWVLTMDDGVEHTFVVEAALVRVVPSPVISDRSLYTRVPALNPKPPAGQPLTVYKSFQGFIDDAWIRLRNDLDAMDNRVEIVTTPQRLREPHLLLTLSLIFADLAARNPAHRAESDRYAEQYKAALATAVVDRDTDGDGVADETRPVRPPVFLM